MRVCHCILGGTKACDQCQNNSGYIHQPVSYIYVSTSTEWPDEKGTTEKGCDN